jgi:hypothetical protein
MAMTYEKRKKNMSDLDKIDRALDNILTELKLNEKEQNSASVNKNDVKNALKKFLQENVAKTN